MKRRFFVVLVAVLFAGALAWLFLRPPSTKPDQTLPAAKVDLTRPAPAVELPSAPSAPIPGGQTSLSMAASSSGVMRSASANRQTTTQPRAESAIRGRFATGGPDATQEAVLSLAKNFANGGSRGRGPNRPIDPDGLEVKLPLAVYNFSLAEIADGVSLNAIQPTAFLYPVESAGHVILGGQVTEAKSGEEQVISILILTANGPSPWNKIGPALDDISSFEKLKAGAFESRILIGNGYLAVWLKSQDGNQDLIYVLAGPNGLEKNKPYTAVEFMRLITLAANKSLLQPKIYTGGAPPENSNGSASVK